MAAAREAGARVTVLASGVPGHWFEHAWLTDLVAAMKGEATTGEGAAWGSALQEIGATDVVTIAAVDDVHRMRCRDVIISAAGDDVLHSLEGVSSGL